MTSYVVAAILVLLIAWLFLGGRSDATEPTTHRRAGEEEIDYAELEQAEREVQEAPDEDSVQDWGPGVQKPPIA